MTVPGVTICVLHLSAAFLFSTAASAQVPQTAEPLTAFVDVSVIPMDRDRVLSHQTVLVQGDRIVALARADRVRVPAAATRIDGRGKFLLPGLADMHVHLWGGGDKAHRLLLLWLANGITTVRDMISSDPELALRDSVARGELLGPRIYTDRVWSCQHDAMAACLDSMQAIKAAGYDFLKIYQDGLEEPDFDSTVAAAKREGLRLTGHVVPHLGLASALRAPYTSIEHLWGYLEALVGLRPPQSDTAATIRWLRWVQPGYRLDPAALRRVAEATRRAGAWNTPTLHPLEARVLLLPKQQAERVAAGEKLSHLDSLMIPMGKRRLEFHQQIVKALHDAGAGLLLGTDAPQGFAEVPIHRELELLVKAGLTPYEALVTGTRNVATYLGTSSQRGTVAVGKQADLVLLEQNPLEDIRHTAGVVGVMKDGRWYPRSELEAAAPPADKP